MTKPNPNLIPYAGKEPDQATRLRALIVSTRAEVNRLTKLLERTQKELESARHRLAKLEQPRDQA